MKKETVISFAIALLLVITLNLFEHAITGEKAVEWFLSLKKPWFLVSLNIFYVVVSLLAIISITVFTRLIRKYRKDKLTSTRNAILWMAAILFFNGLWNYFFMVRENTASGFFGMLLFFLLVLLGLRSFWKEDKISFYLISFYGLWAFYDVIWTYAIWQLN